MNPIKVTSTHHDQPAVDAGNSAGGVAVAGNSDTGIGVKGSSRSYQGLSGFSETNAGVAAESKQFHAVFAVSHDINNAGVYGTNDGGGWGVSGHSTRVGVSGESPGGRGVEGLSASGIGVRGSSQTFQGVSGFSESNAGVAAESNHFHAVFAISHDANNAGVIGINDANGWGVVGRSERVGVSGESTHGRGVMGISQHDVGVHGRGGLLAGFFEGDVKVVGELYVDGNVRIPGHGDLILEGADCAERFRVDEEVGDADAGTVMVICEDGSLQPACGAYDRRVAGVVSGAGSFRPGIILDGGQLERRSRPIALIGKVYCKVDADFGAIEVGDLLTTSTTPGHAMKATDAVRSFGAVLGKAIGRLERGRGLLPMLVALQ